MVKSDRDTVLRRTHGVTSPVGASPGVDSDLAASGIQPTDRASPCQQADQRLTDRSQKVHSTLIPAACATMLQRLSEMILLCLSEMIPTQIEYFWARLEI